MFFDKKKGMKVDGKLTHEPPEEGKSFFIEPKEGNAWDAVDLLNVIHSGEYRYSHEYFKRYHGKVYIRHWCNEGIESIRGNIKSSYEGARILDSDTITDRRGKEIFFQTEDALAGAYFTLERPPFYSMKIEAHHNPYPIKSLLSTLSEADGEYILQILMKSERRSRWYGRKWSAIILNKIFGGHSSFRDLYNKYSRSEHAKEEDLANLMYDKVHCNQPLHFQFRVLGTKADVETLEEEIRKFHKNLSPFRFAHKLSNRFNINFIEPKPDKPKDDNPLFQFLKAMRQRKWWKDGALLGNIRARHPTNYNVFSPQEMKWLFKLPQDNLGNYNIVTSKTGRFTVSPEVKADVEKDNLKEDAYFLGYDERNNKVPILDPSKHTSILGETGTGKSTLMVNQALYRIREGENVVFIDPHGDSVVRLLNKMHPDKLDDVIYIHPMKSPMGINALSLVDFPGGEERLDEISEQEKKMVNTSKGASLDRATEHLGNMIRSHFGRQFYGPRLDDILQWTAKALIPMKGANFVDFYHVLKSNETARRFRKDVQDHQVRGWITDNLFEFEHEHKQSTLNKIGKMVRNKSLRRLLCQRNPPLKLEDKLKPGKVILINLSKAVQERNTINFAGSYYINRIWSSILLRSEISEKRRNKTHLFVDEAGNFTGEILKEMLSEGRKYGLCLTLANQYPSQLRESVWESIEGNVGTVVSFKLGQGLDRMCDLYGEDVEKTDFNSLNEYSALVKTTKGEVTLVDETLEPKANNTRWRYAQKKDSDKRIPEEYVLDNMNKMAPGFKSQMKKSNTPRWESFENEIWDLLNAVLGLKVKNGDAVFAEDVSDELYRDDVMRNLDTLAQKGYISLEGENKKIKLRDKGRGKFLQLAGSSPTAGSKRHKIMVAHIYELLVDEGHDVEIIRQDVDTTVPDLTMYNVKNNVLDYEPCNVEYEHKSKTKPERVLKNLAKADVDESQVIFFVDDRKGAEKLLNILEYPYKDDGSQYVTKEGKTFDPEEEFRRHYWKPTCDTDLKDISCIYIFVEDWRVELFNPEDGKIYSSNHIEYKRAKRDGYYIDLKEQDSLDNLLEELDEEELEKDTDDSEEEDEKSEESTVTPLKIERNRDMDLTENTELREKYYEAKTQNKEDVLEEIREEQPFKFEIMEQELMCGGIRSKIEQPESMDVDLTDVPGRVKGLINLIEGVYAYARNQKYGHTTPRQPVSTTDLLVEIRSQTNIEYDSNFGRDISKLLKKWEVPRDKTDEKSRFNFEIDSKLNYFKSLHRLYLMKNCGIGKFSYPSIHSKTNHIVSRYTLIKLFEREKTKIAGRRVYVYAITPQPLDKLFMAILNGNRTMLKEELENKTGMNIEKIEEVLEDLGVEVIGEGEYDVEDLRQQLYNILK